MNEYEMTFMERVADFQNNGGIILTILAGGILFVLIVGALVAVQWYVWRRELKKVSKKASDDLGQHELNHHFPDLVERAENKIYERVSDRRKAIQEPVADERRVTA